MSSFLFHKITLLVFSFCIFLCPISAGASVAQIGDFPKADNINYDVLWSSFDLTDNETEIFTQFIDQFKNSSLSPILLKIQKILSEAQLEKNSSKRLSDVLSIDQIQELVKDLEQILNDPVIASLSSDLPSSKEEILAYMKGIEDRTEELENVKEYYEKTALKYIESQYSSYEFSSFLSHLEKGLFELSGEGMFTRYRIKGNRLFIIIKAIDSNKVYIFYQESNSLLQQAIEQDSLDQETDQVSSSPKAKSTDGMNIYDIVYEAETERNKDYNKGKSELKILQEALAKVETQERMKKYDTAMIRLNRSGEIQGLDITKAPRFLSDPIRWLKEYMTSIHEKPQFMVSIVATVIQCSILAAIYSLKQKPLVDQIGPLALTAFFSTIMGSFIGTYRNFIDNGILAKRILKESVIGMIFLYSFKILDSGINSINMTSLSGILNNLNIIAVMYFSKMFKYPYTYIPRMMQKYGYYGPEGQASTRFLGLNWNLRTVHNQFVYNVVSFGLKMVGLIGLGALMTLDLPVVGNIDIDLGTVMFLSSPVIALVVNKHWVNNQYDKVLRKYALDPSPTHTKALEKREDTLRGFRKYNYWLYSALGLFTGDFVLKKIEHSLVHGPIISEAHDGVKVIDGLMELADYLQELSLKIQKEEDEQIQSELVEEYVHLRKIYEKRITKAGLLRLAKATRIQKLRNNISKNVGVTARTAGVACSAMFSYVTTAMTTSANNQSILK